MALIAPVRPLKLARGEKYLTIRTLCCRSLQAKIAQKGPAENTLPGLFMV